MGVLQVESIRQQDPFILASLVLTASPKAGHEPIEYVAVLAWTLQQRQVEIDCLCGKVTVGSWDEHETFLELLRETWVKSDCAA
jgi:hypothetical protein